MSKENKLISPAYIGDGLYMTDNDYNIKIAVNHHDNTVAYLDIEDIDSAIEYLTKVKNKDKYDNLNKLNKRK